MNDDPAGRLPTADEHRSVELIVASTRFADVVQDLAERTGRPVESVRSDALACLEEVATTVDHHATQAWDRFGRWLSRSYSVDADSAGLPVLRDLARRHSLVFLPNHRSYLDPLVLRIALGGAGLPPNRILGGINLAKWPVSVVARRSGLVFIRRQSRDDPVYPAMLRLYLGFLLGIHANLEWYFEGGRTRTGKLRPPRMGVLRYLVDAFEAGGADADDVYLVPVAIVYDQQHEVEAISFEEAGGTKTPESLRWLVDFARAQGRRRGRVHVRFGAPLSLRDALQDARDPARSSDPTVVVPRVAFEVAHRINAATPITPSALVTFALLDNDGRALTLSEAMTLLGPLLEYVRLRSLPLTSDVDLGRPDGLRRALRTLVAEGVVEEYRGGLEPVYAVAANRQHEAGFYRNSVTHHFITRAMVEVAVLRASQEPDQDVATTVWEHALRLRDLLKYEFFFSDKRAFDVEVRREAAYALPGWDDGPMATAELALALAASDLLLAHRVVGPFLESYGVVADRLAMHEPAAPVDAGALVTESLGVARQRWLQHQLHSPESISKDLMNGAVRLAGNRDLLGPGGKSLSVARRAFAAELAEAIDAVSAIRALSPQGR